MKHGAHSGHHGTAVPGSNIDGSEFDDREFTVALNRSLTSLMTKATREEV